MNDFNRLFTSNELKEILREELEVFKKFVAAQGTEPHSPWMSTTEVLELLKIGRTTLYNRVKSGKIAAFRDPESNRTYYSRAQIDEYLTSCQIPHK